jgi:hypothetical protein
VSSISRSSEQEEIWYGLTEVPAPPAKAEALCTGLPVPTIPTAKIANSGKVRHNFFMEKNYTIG